LSVQSSHEKAEIHIYLVEFLACPIYSRMMSMAYLSIGLKKISNNFNEHSSHHSPQTSCTNKFILSKKLESTLDELLLLTHGCSHTDAESSETLPDCNCIYKGKNQLLLMEIYMSWRPALFRNSSTETVADRGMAGWARTARSTTRGSLGRTASGRTAP
jgi:hypothetical protein